MSYIPSENGTKVNLIKKKFEENSRDQHDYNNRNDEQRESLRRSLSSSPVKVKKNLKLNVTRQLSNPGKNIKRTPAFRGDKLSRIKNLHSPSREKPPSIVHKNVKIFEETPEYGKIGNVKKKERIDSAKENIKETKEKQRKVHENTVRTTVISRQKNIYPPQNVEDSKNSPKIDRKIEDVDEVDSFELQKNENNFEKFLMNGVEYMRVLKPPKSPEKLTRPSQEDVREDLSRRKSPDPTCSLKLTDSIRAALQAPLPAGPPPKKPPRTFAHSPLTQRNNLKPSNAFEDSPKSCRSVQSAFLDVDCPRSQSDDDFLHLRDILKDRRSPEKMWFSENHFAESPEDKSQMMSPKSFEKVLEKSGEKNLKHQFSSSNLHSRARSTRDSKKMLEKLETVLIQHQKALGPKVIMPRREKNEISVGFESKKLQSDSKSEKRSNFSNRLSRTMEDPKKLNSLPKLQDQKTRKHSTFDCLPVLSSLNCASGTAYEQPTFRNYFGPDDESAKSKSEDSLSSSISNILNSSDLYDDSLSPGSKRLSTELTTFLDGRKRAGKSEERVYAEPFSFDKNSGTDITGFGQLSPEEHNYLSRSWCNEGFQGDKEGGDSLGRSKKTELHYLCTPIDPTALEDNNAAEECHKDLREPVSFQSFLDNTGAANRPSLDGPNRVKAEQLLNQAFGKFVMAGTETSTDSNTSSDTDSLASTLSLNDELTTFSDKLRLFKSRENNMKLSKEELHRSLTEKRKCYVRKVSIKYSEKCDASLRRRRDRLFDVCLLVELNLSTKVPYIKDKYPIYAEVPAWIENFCFPDAQDWPPDDSNQNQFHSLFLMDEKGNRRYGYCIRVKPEGGPILPLAYCLITKYRAAGFYHKVLQQLESKHGLPDKNRRGFIEELYNSSMPKPGSSLRMTKERPEVIANLLINNNTLSDKDSSADEIRRSPEGGGRAENHEEFESIIMRSGDPRLEERDMSQLFDAVSNKVLIFLFGSLLLERKVVFLGSKLSRLSSCVEALQSLLYPFTWPHTFIPVLPDIEGLEEILGAPPPFVIGILKGKSGINAQVGSIQDGIVVDLDTSKVICAVGDEGSILPKRLQEGIRSALQLVSNSTKHGDDVRNFLVSEAFLRVFVETCAHLEGHLVTQQDGKIIFQKESFVKASSSKTVQFFLEWFVETIMFNAFVSDYIASVEGTTVEEKYDIKLFKQRVAEYRKLSEKNAQSKKSKKKTFGKFTFNF